MFESNRQLCWTCGNSCGGCLWSRYFKPVPGWDAEPTVVKQISSRRSSAGKRVYNEVKSYSIKSCPMFKEG